MRAPSSGTAQMGSSAPAVPATSTRAATSKEPLGILNGRTSTIESIVALG
jgi:hypothetical protein